MAAGSILRLRGLPFSATQEDICAFFEGYPTRAVYIGLRNGAAQGRAARAERRVSRGLDSRRATLLDRPRIDAEAAGTREGRWRSPVR